jgi:RHS repeat-associated protein
VGRLSSTVATPEWGNGFVYDGFGNLLQKNVTKGSAPALSIQVDGTTNRLVGWTYDANGHSGSGTNYDVENRLLVNSTMSLWNGTSDGYIYGSDNRRLARVRTPYSNGVPQTATTEVYFYGLAGEMLGAYEAKEFVAANGTKTGYFGPVKTKVWMGGRLLIDGGKSVFVDRLGSVVKRADLNGSQSYKYYAWGEERTIGQTLTGSDQFGTYQRSDLNGLDYAVNRWYSNTSGRFTTADPYQASSRRVKPGGWNRYRYAGGDPVNFRDPRGLCEESDGWDDCDGDGGFDEPDDPTRKAENPDPVRGGGSPMTTFISVKNPSKSGPKQESIRRALNWLMSSIDADCSKWFSGNFGQGVASLLGDPSDPDTVLIGHGEFSTNTISAFTGNNISTTDLPAGYAIAVNDTGGFFSSSYSAGGQTYALNPGGYTGGTYQAQAYILLHELAHFLKVSGFQADLDNAKAQADNQEMIKKKCGKTIDAAKLLN